MKLEERKSVHPPIRVNKYNSLKVQANSTNDVLVRGQPVVDHVRLPGTSESEYHNISSNHGRTHIIHNISTENQGTNPSIYEINGSREWEEDTNESGDDQAHEPCKQEGCHAGEIILWEMLVGGMREGRIVHMPWIGK